MITRQANLFMAAFLLLAACRAAPELPPTPTSTAVPTITATSVPTATATATPLTCLTQPGQLLEGKLETTVPPQEFIIYLPPCYEFSTERYPVVYLLHGQTYRQDQWVRIGAPATADMLIHGNTAQPFIMVFPDDRYWNVQAGSTFGYRLIEHLIPYIDGTYRTRAEKKFRALGGLSRGGGWTAKLGFDRPDLFGALGLHSPALFKDNAPYLGPIIGNIPEAERPQLWHDIGDADTELGNSLLFEDVLIQHDYIHEFYRFTGDHTEGYWSEHVRMYLLWYAQVWRQNMASQ